MRDLNRRERTGTSVKSKRRQPETGGGQPPAENSRACRGISDFPRIRQSYHRLLLLCGTQIPCLAAPPSSSQVKNPASVHRRGRTGDRRRLRTSRREALKHRNGTRSEFPTTTSGPRPHAPPAHHPTTSSPEVEPAERPRRQPTPPVPAGTLRTPTRGRLADSDAPGGRSAGARDANGETVAVVARRVPAAVATDRGHGRNSGSCRSIADGCRSCR